MFAVVFTVAIIAMVVVMVIYMVHGDFDDGSGTML